MASNKVQLLIAAVDAKRDLPQKMGIKGSAIIANQHHDDSKPPMSSENITFVNSGTCGVGINRNLCLLYADGDILLFGDDDMTYCDDYEEKVRHAFDSQKDADMIIFNLHYKNSPVKNTRRLNGDSKRVRIWNALNYGAPRLAIRRESQRKANLWFSTLFGGGARYGAGEDCLFVLDALRKGLKIYTNREIIGETDLSNSSWFKGYGDKFFSDKGALFKAGFGRLSILMILQFAVRHPEVIKGYGCKEAVRTMMRGASSF